MLSSRAGGCSHYGISDTTTLCWNSIVYAIWAIIHARWDPSPLFVSANYSWVLLLATPITSPIVSPISYHISTSSWKVWYHKVVCFIPSHCASRKATPVGEFSAEDLYIQLDDWLSSLEWASKCNLWTEEELLVQCSWALMHQAHFSSDREVFQWIKQQRGGLEICTIPIPQNGIGDACGLILFPSFWTSILWWSSLEVLESPPFSENHLLKQEDLAALVHWCECLHVTQFLDFHGSPFLLPSSHWNFSWDSFLPWACQLYQMVTC